MWYGDVVMKGGVVMVNWLEVVLLREHVFSRRIGNCQGLKGCEVRKGMTMSEPEL